MINLYRLPSSLANTRLALLLVAACLLGGLVPSNAQAQEDGVWRFLGDTNTPKKRHESAYVAVNGKTYILGGRGKRRPEAYNPADSTWTQGPLPPDDIELHHFQAVEKNGLIYIIGAYTGNFPSETAVDSIYTYDTATSTWAIGPEIPPARRRGSAGAVKYNGKFYIVSGSLGGHGSSSNREAMFDEYDPDTDTWTTLPDIPNPRDHFHAAVIGSKLYVAGGRDGSVNNTVPEVDVYDFNTGAWSTLASPAKDLPTPRGGSTSVALDGHLIVIGGESGLQDEGHAEVEAYNPNTGNWLALASLNTGRHGTQATVLNDKIYIVAGSSMKGGGPEIDQHEVFEIGAGLPVELAPGAHVVIDGHRARLVWRTLSETNNAGFEIQHAIGRSDFEAVGFVDGAGTTTEPQDYHYELTSLAPGRHRFRLKQVDFDGGFAFSAHMAGDVLLDTRFHVGAAYPNPFNPEARFTVSVAVKQEVRVDVVDMLGRVVHQFVPEVLEAGEVREYALDAGSWAGGVYVIRVSGTSFMSTQPITLLK